MVARMSSRFLTLCSIALCLGASLAPVRAEDKEPTAETVTVEVTATRVPEATESVPAMITIITGDELRDRGAADLASALSLVGGVSLSQGAGDGGPSGSVPELYGLREADAFLLVVDGIPWGGAFNPSLVTVDLNNVERIEVLRGPAPVMYGATSFVGVIHVIHRAAGAKGSVASAYGGNFRSGGAAVSLPLPAVGRYQQSLSINADRQGFRDSDTSWRRGHLLYRGAAKTRAGALRLDFDATLLRQDPASPTARAGSDFPAPGIEIDANQNPSDAKANEMRYHLAGVLSRPLGSADWTTTLALTRAIRRNTRGFLAAPDESVDPDASGFRQRLWETDVYFDSHIVTKPLPHLQVVAGIDHLFGRGTVDSFNFDYFVHLDGSGQPSSHDVPIQELNVTHDERNFSGVYAQAEWTPVPRLRLEAGFRLNHTREDRTAVNHPLASGGPAETPVDERKTLTRGGGIAGVDLLAWTNSMDSLWLFADTRSTYKPAATDFGPEIEEILDPETAHGYEAGAKGNLDRGRLTWELSAFRLDFRNVVVPTDVAGLPGTTNAHEQRLQGAEAEGSYRIVPGLRAQASYAYHDATFQDFVQVFGGVPTQLEGNRVEMSAHNLAAAGLAWAPASGLHAWASGNYVGSRFLNKRNTARASAYTTWSAGVGYRFGDWEVQVSGANLNDTRQPVAESEFGDAQYYVLPARTIRVGLMGTF